MSHIAGGTYALNHAERDAFEELRQLEFNADVMLLVDSSVTTAVQLAAEHLQHSLLHLCLAQADNNHVEDVCQVLRQLSRSSVRTQDRPMARRAVKSVLAVIRNNAYLHRLLHSNIARNEVAFVRSLVRLGLSSNGKPSGVKDTHLETAVKFNTSVGCVQALLLDRNHACQQLRNMHGHTLLHTAVLRYRLPIVETLLNVPEFPVNAKDHNGATALAMVLQHYNSNAESSDILLKLLRRCPDLDLQCVVPRGTLTTDDGFPLLCAAAANNLAAFRAMLHHKNANVNQCTSAELCVLTYVCEHASSTDMLELLLAHKNINVNNTGPNGMGVLPLMALIKRRQVAMIKLLLAHPLCDPWTPTFVNPVQFATQAYHSTFWQPLDYVCSAPAHMTEAEAVAIVRLIVRHQLTNLGANQALHEQTPRALHRAVRANLPEVVSLLLAYGADPMMPYNAHQQGAAGRTAVSLATQRGYGFAPLLQELSVPPYRNSPLATAVRCNLHAEAKWQLRHWSATRTSNAVAMLPANLDPALDSFRYGWQPYSAKHWVHHAQFRNAVHTVLLLMYWTQRTALLPVMPKEMWHMVCSWLSRSDWRSPIIVHPVDDDSENSSDDDDNFKEL